MKGIFWAALRNEFSKHVRQKFPYVGIVVVVLLAFFWGRTVRMMLQAPETELNGFLVVIKGTMGAVTSVIPLFAVIFATIVVASETAGGTYRNVLSRPIGRAEFLTAKILFAFGYALLLVLCYILAAIIFSVGRYSFGAVVDAGDVVYGRWQIIGISLAAFFLMLFPLFAIVAYGIFVSTAAKSLISAVGIGVGLLFALEPIKHLISIKTERGEWNLSDYIVTSYLDSAPKIASKAAQGIDVEWFGGSWWQPESLGFGLLLSLICAAVFLAASYAIFLRRDLNFS